MKVYKLTDRNNRTRGGTAWGENITHTAPGGTPHQGGRGWLHAYSDPRLAALLHPAHINYTAAVLWEAEAVVVEDLGDKLTCTSITTICQIPLPIYSTEQRVEFAIRCALRVYRDPDFGTWAARWLSGDDRSEAAAEAAWAAAKEAVWVEEATARAGALAEAAAGTEADWAAAAATARAAAARAARAAAWGGGCDLFSVLAEMEESCSVE